MILPNHLSRFGNRFDREAGVCHPVSWWSGGRYHIRGIRRIGTIASALYVDGAPVYGAVTHGSSIPLCDFILVKNGDCYQYYGGESNG